MSTHLAILTRAGLVHVESAGRLRNYRAGLDGMRAVGAYLAKKCSDGCSDQIASIAASPVVGKKDLKASTRTNQLKPASKR
jgi:ArsR family transcriptional regulator